MEDPFAFLVEEAQILKSQQEHLRRCPFRLQDLFPESPLDSDELSAEPIGIVICSPPSESKSLRVDEVGESWKAVELGNDTDLVFPFKNSLLEKDVTTEILEDVVVSRNLGGEACESEVSWLNLEKNEILKRNSGKIVDVAVSRLPLGKNEILIRNSHSRDDLGLPCIERHSDVQVEDMEMDEALETGNEASKLENPLHRVILLLDKIKSEKSNAEAPRVNPIQRSSGTQ